MGRRHLFSAQIADAIGTQSTLPQLDHVARTIWQGLGNGRLSEGEAQHLAELVEACRERIRTAAADRRERSARLHLAKPRIPRSPDRVASIARRRRQAASGAVPPQLAQHFTTGEQAALAVVGREAHRAGACDWPMDKIAAVAGVSRTLARNALRLAARLGLVLVRERRRCGARSLTNVVALTSREWRAWLARGGGCRKPKATTTDSPTMGERITGTSHLTRVGCGQAESPVLGSKSPPPRTEWDDNPHGQLSLPRRTAHPPRDRRPPPRF